MSDIKGLHMSQHTVLRHAVLCCLAVKPVVLWCGVCPGLLGYFRPSIPITAKDLEVRGMAGPAALTRLTGEGGRGEGGSRGVGGGRD